MALAATPVWKTKRTPIRQPAEDVVHSAVIDGMELQVTLTSYGSVWVSVAARLGDRRLTVGEYGLHGLSSEQAMARATTLASELLAAGFTAVVP